MLRTLPVSRAALCAPRTVPALASRAALRPHARSYAVAAPAVGNYAQVDGQATLNSPSELARRISAKVLPRLTKPDVKKVLVVGSGGLSIGQAGEFDYSGSQAIKALRESNIDTVLINPNIATIQTSHHLASEIYFLPVTADYVAYVLEKERPDGILLTFGGQSALNVGIQLDKMGILERLGVQVLGTPIRTLEVSEDRDLFVQALNEIEIPAAQSTAVSTIQAALDAAAEIGYPIILRSAFSLGGLGSGFAHDEEELRNLAAKSLSLSPQVLIEKSLKGWKEVEYEVVRDAADNVIICCNMENFDPLGTHTGDSIVVAPSQTLSDDEYHMLRSAAIKIVRHVGVVGECNVQYALDPNSRDYRVIEMNARLSRSSALASKATGYPLAYTAAKIALGHTLPELPNAVTKSTTACFEPSLDYIVTKIPKWDLAKFQHVERNVGSAMKSVGEVMAIGRTFEESLQKAIRQVDPNFAGFEAYWKPDDDMTNALTNNNDRRLFAIAHAMLNKGYTVDQLHDLTKIDKWFLYKLENIVEVYKRIQSTPFEQFDKDLVMTAKKTGFSDLHIGQLTGKTEAEVRALRKSHGVTPFVKRIDTLAAEFPAYTNYLYTTYNATTHDIEFDEHGTMVLGSGVYRIGSSVEFDWCAVTCSRAIRGMGKKTIMINYNPETVSTDFDEADRLYFEELGFERVMDIYEMEAAEGVVVSVGGQLPQNIALRLKKAGVSVLGTDPEQIDNAEDRHKFSSILDSIGVDQPAWTEATSLESAKEFAARVGYPVLIRPSYVLSGAAMNVVWDESSLQHNLTAASNVSPDHPVVITQFIDNAQEIDVDAVAHKGKLLVHAVSEHVENAGVHSGDATLVLPPFSLGPHDLARLKEIAEKVAKAWDISGPFNMQIIRKPPAADEDAELKVIECNLRASRSFPFVSKVLGHNFIETASAAIMGLNVPEPVDLMAEKRDYVAIKVPQFSWTRLPGADPFLGVEMASTGEVASFGKDIHEAYWAALLSVNGMKLPKRNSGILLGGDVARPEMAVVAKNLVDLGFKLFTYDDTVADAVGKVPYVSIKKIRVPVKDKKKLREILEEHEIQTVVNMARSRAATTLDEDYAARRAAVDFGIPLINNAKLAVLFTETLQKKFLTNNPLPYSEGFKPAEVGSWRDFSANQHSSTTGVQTTMSVVSKNPFDLLGDDGEAPAPVPAKPAAAPAPAAQQPKVVPGAAPKGGRGAPRAPRPNVGRPSTQDAPIEGTENAGGFDGERVPPPKKHHQGRDAHTKGPRENRDRAEFTSGGHRSRGAGAVRGGRTPAQGGERRQYERRPASGAQDSQKKVEQGWGADEGKAELTAEVAGEIDAQADQKVATPAEDAEEGAAADEEAEPATKTLDQYLAEQAEKNLAGIGKKDSRQVSSDTLEGKAFVREAIDEFFSGKQKASAPKEKAAKKEKVYIEVDGQFATPAGRPDRGDRPERGRGGFGGGRGRGAPRGAVRGTGAPRGGAQRSNGARAVAPIDANDQKAFPALGA
ncbi:carbamoyl-phosphate synthase (glutamine-hydrolyzing) cpa2 [Cryptotrichosporon argae]